jgi:hypothetical protein
MPRDNGVRRAVDNIDRRRFIKAAGASAVATTLAGCTSGGNGGDSGGDSDGGDSDGDSETEGGDGGSGDLTSVSFATPPVGMPVGIVIEYYLAQNDLIQPRFEEDGYELDYELTFEDATLFASGQIDMGTVSWVEDARLGVEQDQQLVTFGNIEGVVSTPWVEVGGPYDPDETGSVQASLDKIVEEEARFGIPGWAAGAVPHLQNIIQENYGYTLAQDGGDFNVQTTERGTMPSLTLRGDLATAVHSASSAGLTEVVNGELKPLLWIWNEYLEAGWGKPPLVSLSTRLDFAEENPEVLLNMINMWSEGLNYVQDNIPEIAADSAGQETLEAESEEEARFLMDLFAGNDVDQIEPLSQSALYSEVGLDDQAVEDARSVMNVMEDLGQIPSGWDDHLTFMTVSDIEEMV